MLFLRFRVLQGVLSPSKFKAAMEAMLDKLRGTIASLTSGGGQGIRFLSESSTSPTLAAQIGQLAQTLPQARWHWWEPVNRDNAMAGAQLAFGQPPSP